MQSRCKVQRAAWCRVGHCQRLDGWWHTERARRRKQPVRSRARLAMPVCVVPFFNVWRSTTIQSTTLRRSTALRSAVPVLFSYLLSQWRGGCLSQAPVVLYPDPHAAPFAPAVIPSSVAQRVIERRCLRYPISALPSSQRMGEVYDEWDFMIIQRWWRSFRQQCRPQHTPTGASKLLQCTFTPLRAVLRRWWSRDLFALHSDLLYPNEFVPLNFTVGTSRFATKNILRNANVPEHRYSRVR